MTEPLAWWRSSVIYQIYPRSFADSDADGLGDLNGIRQHLEYLAWLGVGAIWLTPFYPSPDGDFGYDISDCRSVDPRFGSLDDFEALLEDAHRLGIKVIIDLVLNHTSDQHPWFVQSRSSKDNPYRDWYLWRDPSPSGGRPNNWRSRFGGPGWQFDPTTGQYYFHMFYPDQPDLNWRNPDVRAEMLNIFRCWLDRGVDGFRLDVFNAYFKDAAFRSNPVKVGLLNWDRQRHRYDYDQPEMLPVLQEIRALVDSYPDRYLVGETFESTPRTAARYVGPDRLHAAFNFEFTKCPWRAACFLDAINSWESALSPGDWPNYVLGNHDLPRPATRYAQGEHDERLKIAAAMLLTMRGTPYLYYGDEIGMRSLQLRRSELKDRVSRRYWPFFDREGSRSPMQWDASPGAGFSTHQPWLRLHEDYPLRNVAAQHSDPDSLLNCYRDLIALRQRLPALQGGMFIPLIYSPLSLLAFLRKTSEGTALVALNFRRRPNRLALGGALSGPQWQLAYSTQGRDLHMPNSRTIQLAGYEAIVLTQR